MLGLKLNHVNKRGYCCCVVQWSTSPQINSNICHAVASYVQILHHGWLLTLSVFIWATCPERNQVITQSMIHCKELQWQMYLIAVVWIRLKCTRMWHSVSNCCLIHIWISTWLFPYCAVTKLIHNLCRCSSTIRYIANQLDVYRCDHFSSRY